jgi:hypothetical protein
LSDYPCITSVLSVFPPSSAVVSAYLMFVKMLLPNNKSLLLHVME